MVLFIFQVHLIWFSYGQLRVCKGLLEFFKATCMEDISLKAVKYVFLRMFSKFVVLQVCCFLFSAFCVRGHGPFVEDVS